MIKTKATLWFTTLMVLVMTSLNSYGQTTYYVNQSPTAPITNGLTWSSGFESLDIALAAANSGDEIWVKAGTYTPDPIAGRNATFDVPSGVKVYGGFVGTETQLNQRNAQTNFTSLSGDIGVVGNATDNSYHVVTFNNVSAATLLDGFTVEGGNANGSGNNTDVGGGILSMEGNPVISNCVMRANYAFTGAGAMFYTQSSFDPVIEYCDFQDNVGTQGVGLAIFAANSGVHKAQVRYCHLFDNYARGRGAAMMLAGTVNGASCEADIQNCLVDNNYANNEGGALYIRGYTTGASSPIFLNCTFAQNVARNYAGVVATFDDGRLRSKPIFRNCIMWDNSANQYDVAKTDNNYSGLILDNCVLQGGSCTGEIDGPVSCNNLLFSNPQFVNSGSDYRLQVGSAAIDAGNTAFVPGSLTEDLDGNARIVGVDVDMGCYEYFAPCHATPIAYVNHAATGANDGSDWANAFIDLQDALALSVACSQIREIWVAEGTYVPGSNRADRYVLVDQIDIFGGFPNPITWPGNNPGMADRDTDTYLSILSGDIGAPGDNSDNIYHIVMGVDISQGTDFDGLWVVDGHADLSEPPTFNIRVGQGAGLTMTTHNAQVTGITVNDCRFINNEAASGGAISLFSHVAGEDYPAIRNTLFEGNTANTSIGFGGAVLIQTLGITDPTFENCDFSGNVSNSPGAAVQMWILYQSANVTRFINCNFQGNDNAGNFGTGVVSYFTSGGASELNIDKCNFRDNTTAAVSVLGTQGSPVDLNILNTSFFNNSEFRTGGTYLSGPTDAGGAIRMSNVLGAFNHCTFASNQAYLGGAIYATSFTSNTELDLHNCIFWDNKATFSNFWNNSDGILHNGPAINVRMDHSMWQGTTCTDDALMGGQGRITCGAGVIYGQNPAFISLGGGNLDLTAGSPAINTGDMSNSLLDDINGLPRPIGAGVEMGCYESLFSSAPVAIDASALSFKCFPNPARDRVKVTLEQGQGEWTMEVLGLNGEILQRHLVTDQEIELDLSQLSNGLYLLRLQTGGQQKTQRLVVNR